jgi:hypothetical protein
VVAQPEPGSPEFAMQLAERRLGLRHSAGMLADLLQSQAAVHPAPRLPTRREVLQARDSLQDAMSAAHADSRFGAFSDRFEVTPLRERDRATAEVDVVGVKAVYAHAADASFMRLDVFVSSGQARIVTLAVGGGKRLGVGRKMASSLNELDSALSDVMADQLRQAANTGVVEFESGEGGRVWRHAGHARAMQPA